MSVIQLDNPVIVRFGFFHSWPNKNSIVWLLVYEITSIFSWTKNLDDCYLYIHILFVLSHFSEKKRKFSMHVNPISGLIIDTCICSTFYSRVRRMSFNRKRCAYWGKSSFESNLFYLCPFYIISFCNLGLSFKFKFSSKLT